MSIDTVTAASLTPSAFWKEYVSKRRPVMQQELAEGSLDKWNSDYLKEQAGKCEVTVEERISAEDAYGKGKTKRMAFEQFIDEVQSGNETLYLSAQDAAVDGNGFPEVLSSPLIHVKDDIRLRPRLLEYLIPQQINLWMGCCSEGSQSGLHHDYHDNLYILLRGCKHFSLFPPEQAHQMYTHGEIRHVHANGRIVYCGQGDVCADGSDPVDVELRRQTEEQKKISLEVTLSSLSLTDESDLEAILDRCDVERDDYDAVTNDTNDRDSSSHSEDDMLIKNPPKKTKRDEESAPEEEVEKHPPSFSRVDVLLPDAVQREAFPDFPGLSSALQCRIHEGQSLYLPAGWFHNVTSFGNTRPHVHGSSHMALNYWFYPPDNLAAIPDPSDPYAVIRPYRTDYWRSVWVDKYPA